MKSTNPYGAEGEAAAERYLTGQGLRIVDRRFYSPFGELDLVARDGEDWVFVEVRARRRRSFVSAAESITSSKQRRMTRAALVYLKRHRLEGENFRFDAVLLEEGRIEWIRSAFEPAGHYTI